MLASQVSGGSSRLVMARDIVLLSNAAFKPAGSPITLALRALSSVDTITYSP